MPILQMDFVGSLNEIRPLITSCAIEKEEDNVTIYSNFVDINIIVLNTKVIKLG